MSIKENIKDINLLEGINELEKELGTKQELTFRTTEAKFFDLM
ncbi:MAG: hypothetical protein ABI370_06960 [Gammaproteobacteria bacterium]